MIIKSDYRIASVTDGYGVLLRNKHLIDAEHQLPARSVLFVHGATYGSTVTFDYEIGGQSWMDKMAEAGFDAWCLDLLGYGGSDRPDEMAQPPGENPPIVDTGHAVSEVDRAVEFILKDRGVQRLSLIGYSWGSAICGSYAGQFPDKLERLVLSGALWVEQGATPKTTNAELGAYRTVDAESMAKRWAIGLSEKAFEEIVAPDVVRTWCEDVVRTDPDHQKSWQLRAPAGVIKDFMRCAETGEPWYDPLKIQAPTQIVVGELDKETTPDQGRAVFSRLADNIDKRITIIGQGTHSLLLENNRDALHDVVSGFLRG